MWIRARIASRKSFRRAAVIAIGSSVLLFGIALLVLPGPAFVVIPAGLAILGLEFAWARRWMRILKDRARGAYQSLSHEPLPEELRSDERRSY